MQIARMLAGRPGVPEVLPGVPDGRLGPTLSVAVNSSESPAAETVTRPGELAVTGAAAPAVVSVRGPRCGMAVAGDRKCGQSTVTDLVPWAAVVVRLAVSVTAPFGRGSAPWLGPVAA